MDTDTTMLMIYALIGVIVLIIVLGIVYFIISAKDKKKKQEASNQSPIKRPGEEGSEIKLESMKDFLDFDDVSDNMIIRKNREQYIMVLQCQGVNYYLLSEEEQLAVEEGFIQFLNTLRFPIQLYVQTRSLNLKDIVEAYKQRMQGMKDELNKMRQKLEQIRKTGNLDAIERQEFEIRRKENVLEYGVDISEYIGRLSINSNILQQKTYLIISFYASELGDISTYSNDELDNRCFSELYTRAQSIIRTLGSAEVFGKILSSEELAELLYVAYNRSESEALQLSKVLEGEYDSLYSTGKDVLAKKQAKLDEQIELEAIELATESILAADKKRQEQEEEKKVKIEERAVELLDSYKDQMDTQLYEGAKKEIKRQVKSRARKTTKTKKEAV